MVALESTTFIAGVVATLCAAIAIAAWRALLRTGNRQIGFVVAAFALLAAKGVAKAFALATGSPDASAFELVFSLADLTAVGLIAWPIFGRRGGEAE